MSIQEKYIAICHDKGGVGKSTTVINIADALWRSGKKVIVVDGDRIQALRNWSKLRGDNNDSFPVMSLSQTVTYKEPKEIVIFDTAGGIDDEEIADLMSFVDFFILPTNTDSWSVISTTKMAKKFQEKDKQFKVLINRIYGSRGRELMEHFKNENIPVFDQMIPRSAMVEDATDSGRTVSQVSGARVIADKYEEIAEQVLDLLGNSKKEKVNRAKAK